MQNAAAKTAAARRRARLGGAILGLNLASSLETGPATPPLANARRRRVRMGLRLLPLFWVSAERIEFQVPSDLEPGRYELTVQRSGQPDGIAQMEIVPNNPGLYQRDDVSTGGAPPVGVFLRPTARAWVRPTPARRGELVTLLATGLRAL